MNDNDYNSKQILVLLCVILSIMCENSKMPYASGGFVILGLVIVTKLLISVFIKKKTKNKV